MKKDNTKESGALFEDENERFRILWNASFEGILIHQEGKILDVNETFLKMFGYKKEEIIGKNGFDFLIPKKSIELVKKKVREKNEYPYEVTVLKKDGTEFLVENRAKEIIHKDKNIRVVGVRDLSAREYLIGKLEKQNKSLKALYNNGQIINSKMRSKNILNYLTDEAIKITNAKHGLVLVVNQENGFFERVSLRGFSREESDKAIRRVLPLDKGINARAYNTKEIVLINDVTKEEDYFPLLPQTKSELVIPIVKGREVIGNLDLQSDMINAFKDVDIEYLKALANQVAIALTNARNYEKIKNIEKVLQEKVRDRTKEIEKTNKNLKSEIKKRIESEKKILFLNSKLEEYAQKLDLKIKRIDEKRIPLTKNEKKAFYGLINYPNSTSREIAHKLNMHVPTVNAIKNRLKKEGYFQEIYFPNYNALGFEIFSIVFVKFNDILKNNSDIRKANDYEKFLQKIETTPEIIFSSFLKDKGYFIIVAKDWNKYQEIQESYIETCKKLKLPIVFDNNILFQLQKCESMKNFDFSQIFKNIFSLEFEDNKRNEKVSQTYELNQKEKEVLKGLMKYPNLTVSNLSKKINVSVPTICKLKKKLLDNNIIKRLNLPNIKKLGMELLIISHYTFTDEFMKNSERKENKFIENPNIFYTLKSKNELLAISIYRNYTEFEESKVKINEKSMNVKVKQILIPVNNVIHYKADIKSIVENNM